jgi:SNF2 family DNA or RNA helicase
VVFGFFLAVLGVRKIPTTRERIESGFESYLGLYNFTDAQAKALRKIKDAFIANLSSHGRVDLDARLKAQAAAIRSLNDAWGVFSRSRIDLLPHQLWVCYRALQQWPIRLLIADDVGLGKTIEAGLILWPLLSSGKVRRLLILTPASLVEQWQYRLRTLFDIRYASCRDRTSRYPRGTVTSGIADAEIQSRGTRKYS